jgi:diguanylate cyclase (GGDEF)-like protein
MLDVHLPGLRAVMQRLADEIDGVGALGRHELELIQDGQRTVLEVSIGGTRVAGQPLFVLVLRDLPERAERELALEAIASRDDLTGVLNRRGLHRRTALGLGSRHGGVRRSGDGFGLLLVDLDGFKTLNDSHGHAAGDAVLQGVARRIAATLRGDDAVARWGGDEFVVMLHGVTRPCRSRHHRKELLEALAVAYDVAGARCRCASVSAVPSIRFTARISTPSSPPPTRRSMRPRPAGGGQFQLAADAPAV